MNEKGHKKGKKKKKDLEPGFQIWVEQSEYVLSEAFPDRDEYSAGGNWGKWGVTVLSDCPCVPHILIIINARG